MAPSPFRRRKAAKNMRNLAIAEAAMALARDRVGHGSRRPSGKLLLLGGAIAAAGAAALLKRDKVAGLLPSRAGEPEPVTPAPPQPSNYDLPGPVANTATPIPAPDPHGEPPATIDEDGRGGRGGGRGGRDRRHVVRLRGPGARRAGRRGAPPARRGRRGRVRGPRSRPRPSWPTTRPTATPASATPSARSTT